MKTRGGLGFDPYGGQKNGCAPAVESLWNG